MTRAPIYQQLWALMLLILILPSPTVRGATSGFLAMQSAYEEYRPLMSNNAFHQPLHIKSTFNDDFATGEIYALIDNEFQLVASNLITARQWCDMLILHVNVKGCYVGNLRKSNEDVSDESTQAVISLFAGRNFYQPIEDAYEMTYKLSILQHTDDFIKMTLTSESGPYGTANYLLAFEAIPLNEKKTFIHFKYSYEYGLLARIALEGYLATLGRKKVGFTIENYDENNDPVYVKGLQGIVERNSMRYFLAIRAYLDTVVNTSNYWNRRIEHWYELALPYKRQLLEVEDKKYLETKREEHEKRLSHTAAEALMKSEVYDW